MLTRSKVSQKTNKFVGQNLSGSQTQSCCQRSRHSPENHKILYESCELTTWSCGFVRCWLVSASGEVYRHSKKSQGLWFIFPKKFFEPEPRLTLPALPSTPAGQGSSRSTATVIGHTERKQQEISQKMSPIPESTANDPVPTQTCQGCRSRL